MIEPIKFLQQVGIKECYFSDTPKTAKHNRRKEYKSGDKVRSLTLRELKTEIDIAENILSEETKKQAKETQERNFQKRKEAGAAIFISSHNGKSPYLSEYGYIFKNKVEQKEYFKAYAHKKSADCL